MKNVCLFLILALSHSAINVYAQGDWKFKYTKRTAVVKYPGDIRLVAGISGHHHLIAISPAKKPVIYIYNDQLEMITDKELPLQNSNGSNLQVLSFNKFYFLCSPASPNGQYDFLKISAAGDIKDLSDPFNKLILSVFKRTGTYLQWTVKNNNLLLIGHTHYKEAGKMVTTVLQADSLLNPLHVRNVAYDFSTEGEKLEQLMFPGDNEMLILKKKFRAEEGNILELIKMDLTTGTAITTSYTNKNRVYANPGLLYNAADSTILLYSLLAGHLDEMKNPSLLVCRLDKSLNEMTPVTLIKSNTNDKTISHFLLVEGSLPHWIGFSGYKTSRYSQTITGRDTILSESMAGPQLFSTPAPDAKVLGHNSYSNRFYRYNGIRFVLLNKEFKVQNDSLVDNEKRSYYILPNDFSRVKINGKTGLLLIQYFSPKRKGLLLMHSDDGKHFNAEDIRVHDRYDYVLTELKQTDTNTIVLPYISRSEVGLVKVMME